MGGSYNLCDNFVFLFRLVAVKTCSNDDVCEREINILKTVRSSLVL